MNLFCTYAIRPLLKLSSVALSECVFFRTNGKWRKVGNIGTLILKCVLWASTIILC